MTMIPKLVSSHSAAFFSALTFMFLSLVLSHDVNAQSQFNCTTFVKNGLYAPSEQPVLFGKEFIVPELRIRFRTRESKDELPNKITLFYIWEWFRYPNPDHPNGGWDEAGDIIDCDGSISSDIIKIPGYSVEPKGWYKGDYAGNHKNMPRFSYLEIGFDTPSCRDPRLQIKKKDIHRFKSRILEVSLPCVGQLTHEFVKP